MQVPVVVSIGEGLLPFDEESSRLVPHPLVLVVVKSLSPDEPDEAKIITGKE
jgi:hypothetical protein